MSDLRDKPAFPPAEGLRPKARGLTLLEYYAGQVATGLLSGARFQEWIVDPNTDTDRIGQVIWDLAEIIVQNHPDAKAD